MEKEKSAKPRIFVDSDVLFAGAATSNENSASLVVLRMAEITLVEAITSEQVIYEVERNLTGKMEKALPAFHLIVNRCLRIVPDPSLEEVASAIQVADGKDMPILLAAVREGCSYLTTFNVRHYQPGLSQISVLSPGDLVLRIRYLLTQLNKHGAIS